MEAPGEETGRVGVSDLMGVGECEAEDPTLPTEPTPLAILAIWLMEYGDGAEAYMAELYEPFMYEGVEVEVGEYPLAMS